MSQLITWKTSQKSRNKINQKTTHRNFSGLPQLPGLLHRFLIPNLSRQVHRVRRFWLRCCRRLATSGPRRFDTFRPNPRILGIDLPSLVKGQNVRRGGQHHPFTGLELLPLIGLPLFLSLGPLLVFDKLPVEPLSIRTTYPLTLFPSLSVWEPSELKENISKKRIKTLKTLFFLTCFSKYTCLLWGISSSNIPRISPYFFAI
jgi:hypothetical protein